MILSFISWISVILTLIAAYMNASKNANLKRINILYFLSNLINLIVFLYCQIWPYFLLAVILLIIAGKGIRTNRYIPLISKKAWKGYCELEPGVRYTRQILANYDFAQKKLEEWINAPIFGANMSKMKWTKKGWVSK